MSKQIDPRGPRFGAVITTAVVAMALITLPTTTSVVLLGVQLVAHGLGAFVGLSAQPYGVIYRKFVQPRLAKPTELEDEAPPKFAQLVGFTFALAALVAIALDQQVLAQVIVVLHLAASFLNGAFNFCLGCQMYLIGKRVFSN
ncbi:MAG: DUF4395 domain-containing protein [Actinobacteria bacterium]|nr:DUF4395 domain-containing protein [Actinomycetota bacterium]